MLFKSSQSEMPIISTSKFLEKKKIEYVFSLINPNKNKIIKGN